MQADTATWVGQRLAEDRFEVTAKLGAGGMGFVYLARDLKHNHDVVIKVPRQQMLDNPEFAARFMREIRSLIRLAHDHIVKVIDVGEYETRPFVVLDFLPGGSLRDRFDGTLDGAKGARPLTELRTWLPGIAAALDFCHRNDCIHRDVKPDNILFDAAGRAYLSDFGIAKVLRQALSSQQTVMTAAGMVLGTPQYMAPELILGQGCDGRADQYALAVAVYEALSGKFPVDGPNPGAILVLQATQKPVPLDKLRAGLPPGLAAAVARGLHKNAKDRFASCSAFAEAVMKALLSGEGRPAPARPRQPQGAGPIDVLPVPDESTLVGAPVQACPKCKKLCRLTAAHLGKTVRCPRCETRFHVPAKQVPTPARESLDTDAVRQGAIKTPPSTPAAGGKRFSAFAQDTVASNWKRWIAGAALLIGFFLVLIVGGGTAAYLLWPRKKLDVQMDNRAVVQAGGEVTIPVKLKRQGLRGPVEITVKDLPPSLRVDAVTIAEAEDAGKFIVVCPAGAAEGETALTVVFKAGDLRCEMPLKITIEWGVGEIKVFKGHAGAVTAVAFSGDGTKVVSGCVLGDLRSWSVTTGQQLGGPAFTPDPVVGLAVSADGSRAVAAYRVPVGSKNLSLRLWSLGGEFPMEPGYFDGLYDPILAVAWPSDEEGVFAVALPFRRATPPFFGRWKSTGGEQLAAQGVDAQTVVFAPGGKFVLMMNTAGKTTATIWNVIGMKEEANFAVDFADCQVMALAPTGTTAAFAAPASIRVWTLKDGSRVETAQLAEPGKTVAALALSADGSRLLVGTTTGKMELWAVTSKQLLKSFQGHTGAVKCLAFSADGRFAVSGGADGTVRMWKLPR